MQIIYIGFKDKEQKTAIKKLIDKYKYRFPFWANKLTIIHGGESNLIAEMHSHLQYHNFEMRLYDKFFAESEKDREISILHEIYHLYTARLDAFTSDCIDLIKEENEDLAGYLSDRQYELTEEITEEFARKWKSK